MGPEAMILVFWMFSFKPTIWLQLHVESEKGEITDRTDWFQIGKDYVKAVFNLYAEYIMWNAGLDAAQAGIKIAGNKYR